MNDLVTVAPSMAPSTPMQVMRAGNTISPDVLQFLSTEVGLTASRERDRRVAIVVLAPIAGALIAGIYLTFNADVVVTIFGAAVASSVVLFGGLVWGVRNRALLDQVARDAAIAPAVLTHAVGLVRRGAGPSSALRQALDTSSSSST